MEKIDFSICVLEEDKGIKELLKENYVVISIKDKEQLELFLKNGGKIVVSTYEFEMLFHSFGYVEFKDYIYFQYFLFLVFA